MNPPGVVRGTADTRRFVSFARSCILGWLRGSHETDAVLTPATEGGYCALNPETGTVSQGETVALAVSNLREAVELYLEEFPFRPAASGAAPIVTSFEVADA